MNDQKMADAILAMMRLPPGERATVMYVVDRMGSNVDKPIASTLTNPVAREPSRLRLRYEPQEIEKIREYARGYNKLSPHQKAMVHIDLAKYLKRNEIAARQVLQEQRRKMGLMK